MEGSSIFISQWFNKGLNYIGDFLNNQGEILSLSDLNRRFGITVPFTTYFMMIKQIKSILHNYEFKNIQRPIIPNFLKIILSQKKGCSNIYNWFNRKKLIKPKHEIKWDSYIGRNMNKKWWQKHYILPFKLTKDTKLQWLQYRIIYRILATNSYLFRIGYKNSEMCTFCNFDKETIQHLFWECTYVQEFWNSTISLINNKLNVNIQLTVQDVIFGKDNVADIINMVILLGKSYIYQQRVNNSRPIYTGFISFMKYYQKMEKIIYCRKNKIESYRNRWRNPL